MVVGHVAPEAYAGGTIALVQEGDSITIDAHQLLLQLNVDDAEIARRRAAWQAPAPRYTRGVLAKFAKNASSASRGAVLDARLECRPPGVRAAGTAAFAPLRRACARVHAEGARFSLRRSSFFFFHPLPSRAAC